MITIFEKQIWSAMLVFVFTSALILNAREIPFRYTVIDKIQIGHRFVGDVDRDGLNDVVAINHSDEKNLLVWYKYPDWSKFIITVISDFKDFASYRSCDMELADIDGDGDLDVVGRIGKPRDDVNGINVWFENPLPKGDLSKDRWKRRDIGKSHYAKDIEVADFNMDQKADVALRTTEGKLHVYLQVNPADWSEKVQEIPHHDGMDVGDIDRDGDPDIALNGFWMETPAEPMTQEWIKHDYDAKWYTQKTGDQGRWFDNNTKVVTADMNEDGCLDIVIAQAEDKGYPVSWYRAPVDPKHGHWKENIVGQIDYSHSLHAADFENDGDLDIMAAEMPRYTPGNAPIAIFINDEGAAKWHRQELAGTGSYSAVLGDIGNDGDLDIVGVRSYNEAPIELWENLTSQNRLSLDEWTHILVDSTRSRYDGKTGGGGGWFGLAMADMTGDGYRDIVSGKWFYRNPGGDMTGEWSRVTLGDSIDAVLITDVDGDEYADFIALKCNQQFWYEANDAWCSSFTMRQIGSLPICNHGTGSQGYNLAQIVPGGKPELVFTGKGIYYIEIPEDPKAGEWPSTTIMDEGSNGEWVSASDMDDDGYLDVCAGFRINDEGIGVAWWKNPGDGSPNWMKHQIGVTRFHADKFIGADVNGDGRKDMVVTEERYPGLEPDASMYWFEAPEDPKSPDWQRHLIVTQYSMNNLDVADIDRDGDMDLVTCEHKGPKEQLQIWENDGKAGFRMHLLDAGKESHLGSILKDMDGDGDLDVISIAWEDFQFLHVWRNDALVNQK